MFTASIIFPRPSLFPSLQLLPRPSLSPSLQHLSSRMCTASSFPRPSLFSSLQHLGSRAAHPLLLHHRYARALSFPWANSPTNGVATSPSYSGAIPVNFPPTVLQILEQFPWLFPSLMHRLLSSCCNMPELIPFPSGILQTVLQHRNQPESIPSPIQLPINGVATSSNNSFVLPFSHMLTSLQQVQHVIGWKGREPIPCPELPTKRVARRPFAIAIDSVRVFFPFDFPCASTSLLQHYRFHAPVPVSLIKYLISNQVPQIG